MKCAATFPAFNSSLLTFSLLRESFGRLILSDPMLRDLILCLGPTYGVPSPLVLSSSRERRKVFLSVPRRLTPQLPGPRRNLLSPFSFLSESILISSLFSLAPRSGGWKVLLPEERDVPPFFLSPLPHLSLHTSRPALSPINQLPGRSRGNPPSVAQDPPFPYPFPTPSPPGEETVLDNFLTSSRQPVGSPHLPTFHVVLLGFVFHDDRGSAYSLLSGLN